MSAFKDQHRKASEILLEAVEGDYPSKATIEAIRTAKGLEAVARPMATNAKQHILATGFMHTCDMLVDAIELGCDLQ